MEEQQEFTHQQLLNMSKSDLVNLAQSLHIKIQDSRVNKGPANQEDHRRATFCNC